MARMHLHVAPSIVLPAGSALRPDSPCRAFQLYHGWPVVLVADHRAGAWTDKDASTGKTGLPGVGTDRDGPLAAIFLWSPTLLYPYYASKIPLWSISHISDQQWAGMVMI